MRYIITQSQLHSIVYKFLDNMFKDVEPRREQTPYIESNYRIKLPKIKYFYYGPGEYDDGSTHAGVGILHIHPEIVDTLRQMITIRESKVLDIIADWFSQKFEVDIDEISVYPDREKPPVY